MAGKPNKKSVLQYYSHDELLDLAKVKAKLEADERIAEAQRHLNNALSDLVGGSAVTRGPGRPPKSTAKKSPGRPPGRPVGRPKGTNSAKKKTTRKRAKNEKPLADYVLNVLDKKPKGVSDIMEGVLEQGYQTTSKNPKSLLYLELSKQAQKGTVENVGKGKYIKK